MKKCAVAVIAFAFLVVSLFFAPATSVNAAVYDISDYFDYNDVDKESDTRTAFYSVNVEPYTRVWRGDGSYVTDGYGSFDWVFPTIDNPNYRAVISVYSFGGFLDTNSDAHDFVLDVSDIMDGTEVTISADIAVRFDEMTGSQIPTLDISYRTFVFAYDANMKYVAKLLTGWKSSSLVAEGFSEVENSLSYTLPRNTFYIGIVSQFRIDSTYSIGTMHWGVAPRPVVLSVPVDMIYEQSQTMQKIEQQVGNIISGTPQQNQTAIDKSQTIAGQKDKLQDLTQHMKPSTPDMDDVDISVDALAPSGGVMAVTGAIAPVLNNELIRRILFIVASLALVSTVLFGKKE